MLDLKTKIVIGVASGLLVIAFMILIIFFYLVWRAIQKVKQTKCGNLGDVESCIKSKKNTQEKIIGAKLVIGEACTLQYLDEYRIYANSGTLSPRFCGTNKGP